MIVQYVGFDGRANLGDDVIREAFGQKMPSANFHSVPLGRDELLRHSWSHRRATRGAPLLLGGGTLIGRELWRETLDRSRWLFSPSGWEMLGAGVEDPDFRGAVTHTSAKELARWRRPLARFRAVTVRGPRSQAILADAGIDSAIVGDPALLLTHNFNSGPRPVDILVNATCGEDQWGGPDLDWTPELVESLRPFVESGCKIEFLSMESTDDRWNHRVADQLGLDPQIWSPKSHREFFDLADRSRLILGTRLHCNILAAVASTPTIALEYRPKCRDFMASVDLQDLTHRVDQIDTDRLVSNIADVLNGWATAQTRVTSGVETLRTGLEAEYDRVSAAVGTPLVLRRTSSQL